MGRRHRFPGTARLAGLSAAVVAIAMLAVSCELLFMPEPSPSPEAIFDEVWTFADTHYSFFELKDVDWDEVRARYRPLVRADMREVELFDLLADMLYELEDGHVNLRSPFNLSRYWQWYLDYPANFDPALLEREYYRGAQEYAGPFVLLDLEDDNIGYARYASFAQTVTARDLDYLFTRFADRDGIIFDVRSNGGGSTANAYRIAGRLVEERTDRGYQVFKNGPGHEDFTDPQTVWIAPPSDAGRWRKPFVVLANRSSYSATNTFVALVKGLDQVTIVGDATGGGGGIPAFTELSNGWLLRVSAHRFFTADELNIERGIDPDLRVDMLEADAADGRDTIIETALDRIRE